MPLNFSSKVFPRRRSSGNVLDEAQRPKSEGFRVMSQVEVETRKLSHVPEKDKKGRLSGLRTTKGRQHSFEEDIPAGNSSLYDNSSSSARFSSSSTLPSSAEKEPSDNIFASKNSDSRTFSLHGRTFTFGGKGSKAEKPQLPPPLPNQIPPIPHIRERSMTTTSYASTALPPQVDTKIDRGSKDFSSGFDNLFEGLSNAKTNNEHSILQKPLPPGPIHRTESEPILAVPPRAFTSGRQAVPNPIKVDRAREDDFSPHSWGSRTSQDGLISTSLTTSPIDERAPPPPVPPHRSGINPRVPPEAVSPSSDRSDSPYRLTNTTSQPSYLSLPQSLPHQNISGANSSDVSPKQSFSSLSSNNQEEKTIRNIPYAKQKTPVYTDGGSVTSNSTPRAGSRRAMDDEDEELAASAAAAMNFTDRPPANKVMNQAQYNSYRKQQELRSPTEKSDSESEDSDNYDEEDEAERAKELARQRRKQEATMSVYRQQMSKMTGEKPMQGPSTSGERPSLARAETEGLPRVTIGDGLDHTLSVLEGGNDLNRFSAKSSSSGKSGGEESPDEDTPLGILMAHGFPTKTRPPSKMMGAGQPVIAMDRPLSAGNPRASTMLGGGGKSLPPFARGLPRDIPNYYGDGLVNPANRESLAFGNSGAASVYGGSTAGDNNRNQTLVNVIANEERSKAMRRGSPNARNGYGPMMQSNQSMPNFQMSPSMGGMGMMGMGSGMNVGGMGMPSPGGPMDPAMAQFMMQQQMLQQQLLQSQQAMAAMLQQQMAMNGSNGPAMNHPMTPMGGSQNGFLSPNSNYAPSARPMSMLQPNMQTRSSTLTGRPQSTFNMMSSQPRTNSMVRPPSTFNLNLNIPSSRESTFMGQPQGYTPSIAPSERSTIGMARRYRPVNTQVGDGGSVVSNTTLQPSAGIQQPMVHPTPDAKPKPGRGKAFLNAFKRDKKHEDIEEEDWSDVAQRRSRFIHPDRKQERELNDLCPQNP